MMVFDWDGRHISNAFSYSYEKATRKLVAFGQGHIGVHFMEKAHSRTTTGRVLV
jgi:type III secretion system FlhB-like substrate exporter